ncbi:carbonic anhydrase [Streptomyces lonegramiae]|uniref:carbonic anhydrase n=1 Tax=Streptomyces lonegramiae TaxID=3075524 RepID=A0ABU2X647_9ACTN|nr:carbonic anhydrase [Streptomyces sp. DSM 41529]MDT0541384.1 carbonic anhydrase [Streptomyces sp. DSM 41529]
MSGYTEFTFQGQPGYDEAAAREIIASVIPVRTIAMYCFDPRAAGAAKAVADYFGDEVYPGELILDEAGRKMGSTATVFPLIVGGGRAADALRSITVSQHLFGIERVVVVHHSFCGATSFTAEGITAAWKNEQHTDISSLYDWDGISIADFEKSLNYDVSLIRNSPGTPKHIEIYGLFYDIDSGELTEVVRDVPAEVA